ncbi:MAG TPA: hypothetical protein PKN04_00655 [bacterium]|jgi:hypothetical protein|nr:hypothetical protein [bacterium]HNT64268.1 hypothetical protein [bacterium]
MRKSWLVVLSAVMISTAFAETGDGGYAGAFLRMGVGARAKAMGDALTALPSGAASGIYNPALLPHLKNREVQVSFAFLPLDRNLDFVGYAQPLHAESDSSSERPISAGFALAWIHAGVDEIDGRDFSGNRIGTFSNSEHAFVLSFAINPLPWVSVGLNGKVVYNRFPHLGRDDEAVSAQGFGLDIGAFANPLPGLMVGAVLHDNLSKYTWNTDKVWDKGTSTIDEFPKISRFAVAYRIPQQWLLLALDVEDSQLQNPRYHGGIELSAKELGALRMGLDDDKLTFGLGFQVDLFGKETRLDYAFVAGGAAPHADHIFSWAFVF